MHTPPIMTEIRLTAGHLPFDDSFYSMLVGLLSKIRAGQSFNCPVFSYKNEKFSIYEREKKNCQHGLCWCQESQSNSMKTQHPAGLDLPLAGNTILTLKQQTWLAFQQQRLPQPSAQWTTKAQSKLAWPEKSFLNTLLICDRRYLINMSQFHLHYRIEPKEVKPWELDLWDIIIIHRVLIRISRIKVMYPQWEGQLTWCQDESE